MSRTVEPSPIPNAIDRDRVLAIGRHVLATEAEAIWSLDHGLGSDFLDAIDTLLATSGRIVVCGLGKSGHIARKIASSLAATGTPACFLHAGEAMHGDLGVLMAGDALLILSNSGDTREFGAVMRHAERLGAPVVAITSAARSAVGEAADVCLLLPAKPETCRYGSAPTTSTTMMLALGDALTVVLMHLRGVGPEDLGRLHPGGRLGLDLTPVDSFMRPAPALPLVRRKLPMRAVLDCISAHGVGVAGVINDGNGLAGVITDGDIRRHAFSLADRVAEDVMTPRPRTLTTGAAARDALAIFSEARITSLFVLDGPIDRRVLGLVHVHDLLRLGIG